MNASAWIEVQLAMGGALRLARGDRRGLGFFDASLEGFWRSFRAALICYPFYLLLLSFRVAAPQWHASGMPTIVIVETTAYVISWAAFPLLILPLVRWLGREEQFFAFMVPYNWSQVPQSALFVLIALNRASGLLPPTAGRLAEFAALLAVMVYEWYIARVALAISGAQASSVVIADLVLGVAVSHIAEGLY